MPEDIRWTERGQVQRTFYISPVLYRMVKIRAAELDCSISAVINNALVYWLADHKLQNEIEQESAHAQGR